MTFVNEPTQISKKNYLQNYKLKNEYGDDKYFNNVQNKKYLLPDIKQNKKVSN